MLIDTHCHVHESDYPIDGETVIRNATDAGVMQMICIGSSETSSREAVEFASKHDEAFASVGVHPHYAKDGIGKIEDYINQKDVVAIGEIGLDYYYTNSPREDQIKILKQQIELAIKYDLPIIFHVREAYDDFWSVIDEFKSANIRGVLHCFTDTIENANQAINRGLYIGVNGISTFTKEDSQKVMFASLPLNKILLETDAPFLTPNPLRGKVKVNEPAFIKEIAQHVSSILNIPFDEVAKTTTANARSLFNL